MSSTRFYIFREPDPYTQGRLIYCAYRREDRTDYICLALTQDECRAAATFKLDNEPLLVEIVEKGHG
jgi:hypothetical protein